MEKIKLPNIEAERVRHRLSKQELADTLEVSTKTYLNWLRGTTEIPAGKIILMKEMWGVSADYLLEVRE